MTNIEALQSEIAVESQFLMPLQREIEKRIVGQQMMTERLLIGLLTGGHILLEGMPGLAKTLAIKTLSACVSGKFSRIQFTPDLLPADITGTMIYNPARAEFQVRQGPIFANFVLADEINRAPAKVQSALLEAMQEQQVTIGNQTFVLETPFLVLATQNPIEQEGTYRLPEAQADRFMLKIKIDYPTQVEERDIIRRSMKQPTETEAAPQAIVSTAQILSAQRMVRRIYMDEKIEQYILDLVFATRAPQNYGLKKLGTLIHYGASPRASINLALAAKAHAFLQHRPYVSPQDVRALSYDVLRHRIGLTYEAEAESIGAEEIIHEILNTVQIP